MTITPKPDKGYAVDKVTVKDAKGNTVKVTDNGDGTYTFTMPKDTNLLPVTVSVTFKPVFNYIDVSAKDWYYDYVKYVTENGLMQGTSTYLFSPDANVRRGDPVLILYRNEGEPKVKSANKFTDVAQGSYYQDAVIWASENNIVAGYAKRSEIAKMISVLREKTAK